jgi:hypothetical protein
LPQDFSSSFADVFSAKHCFSVSFSESSMNRFQLQFRSWRVLCLPAACLTVLWFAGCSETGSEPSSGNGASPVVTAGPLETDTHAEHAHPSEGPHHGDLVELGNEEFHAEVVHGDGGSVSVYILDSAAKVTVPIDAAELTINITHDGNAMQFKLPADRDAADPEGKSSRFTLKDEELAKDLDSHDAAARLVVMINGKSYSGKIAHDHGADHKH